MLEQGEHELFILGQKRCPMDCIRLQLTLPYHVLKLETNSKPANDRERERACVIPENTSLIVSVLTTAAVERKKG